MSITGMPIVVQEKLNETHIRWYNQRLDQLKAMHKSAQRTFICGSWVTTYKKNGWRAGWWTMQGDSVVWHSMSGFKTRQEILDAVIDSF